MLLPMSRRNTDQSWIVNAREDGLSLQEFLALRLDASRRVAKQQIDARVVWVNDRCVWMARHTLRRGDTVRLTRPVASPTAVSARPAGLKILFEDENYLVADKPPGLLSNEGEGSVEAILQQQCRNPALRVVHRLDRETSGCLLAAKQQMAFDAAVEIFKQHRIVKIYRCIVYERWDATASTLDLPIEGERALTGVTCVRANNLASHLIVRIETGRTHQIRRHLAMARHPVLGDRQYGPKKIDDPLLQSVDRAILHAVELKMDHPLREGQLKVFSPLPADFHRWLKALKLN